MQAVQKIVPIDPSVKNRPFWSVMIPAYNPPAQYLTETLRCVLAQDQGPERMQIEVVDDCSPKVDVESLVKESGGGRVAYSRTPKNLGLAGCWNTCIERARGEWVHILHQDDLVLPGFYNALERADSMGSNIGAAICRFSFADENGNRLHSVDLLRSTAGVLENWLEKIGCEQHIQCPSIAVRRRIYEKVGGFRTDLPYTLDWEMWIRIAKEFEFWYEPQMLALYRFHSNSETSKLVNSGENIRDICRCIRVTNEYFEPAVRRRVRKTASRLAACGNIRHLARHLLVERKIKAALIQLFEALKLSRDWKVCLEAASFFWLWARLVRVRFVRCLKNKPQS